MRGATTLLICWVRSVCALIQNVLGFVLVSFQNWFFTYGAAGCHGSCLNVALERPWKQYSCYDFMPNILAYFFGSYDDFDIGSKFNCLPLLPTLGESNFWKKNICMWAHPHHQGLLVGFCRIPPPVASFRFKMKGLMDVFWQNSAVLQDSSLIFM